MSKRSDRNPSNPNPTPAGRQPAASDAFPHAAEQPTLAFTPDGLLTAETLAAWLDEPDAFSTEDAARIRQALATQPANQQTLAELRLVVHALGNLPEITPSRSFTLTTQAARSVRPPVLATRRDPALPRTTNVVQLSETSAWQLRQQRTLRWASAVAALLLVFVLGVDAFNGGGDSDLSSKDTSAISMSSDLPPASGGNADMGTDSTTYSTTDQYAPLASPASGEIAESEPEQPANAADDTAGGGGGAGTGSGAGGGAEEGAPGSDTGRSATTAEVDAEAEAEAETEAQPESANAEDGDSAVQESALGTGPTALQTTPAAETNAAADTLASDESLRESTTLASADEDADEPSALRLLEYGLAMLALWLLIALLALPYLRQRAASTSTYRTRR